MQEASLEVVAGPYELHSKKTNERYSISIMGDNMLVSKKYQGNKQISETKEPCADFETAFIKLEEFMQQLRDEQSDENVKKSTTLGKRQRSRSPSEGNKRQVR
jgi:ATP-dependent DNA ligase